jgi:uncharacterized protein YecT (DUF1311 family)
MTLKLVIGVFVVANCATTALAQVITVTGSKSADPAQRFSQAFRECFYYGELHNTIAIPARECYELELRLQDELLNKAYAKARASRNSRQRARLRTEQRIWIIERDRRCNAKAVEAERSECLIDETMARAAVLH